MQTQTTTQVDSDNSESDLETALDPQEAREMNNFNRNQLQVDQQVRQSSRNNHKTFLVRISSDNQTQGIEALDIIDTINQNENMTTSPRSSIEKVRIAKVFDNRDEKSLSEISNEIRMRKEFVGKTKGIVQSFGAAQYNQDLAFVDSNGTLYHYPKGYHLIVYEYCSQGDLFSLMENQVKQSPRGQNTEYQLLIRKIFHSLLINLSSLQSQSGVSFLNLNLTKVLLNEKDQPFLYDFSYAKTPEDSLLISDFKNLKDSVIGQQYLAPEINDYQTGTELNGEKIDVFALGIMLFNCLFLGPFCKKATRIDPIYQYLYSSQKADIFRIHPLTRRVKIEDDLKILIKAMLNPNPKQRPTLKELLMYKWFQL